MLYDARASSKMTPLLAPRDRQCAKQPRHCSTLHYTTLRHTSLHFITPHHIALHCIALHGIALRCVALRCIALRCVALHHTRVPRRRTFITLHYTRVSRRRSEFGIDRRSPPRPPRRALRGALVCDGLALVRGSHTWFCRSRDVRGSLRLRAVAPPVRGLRPPLRPGRRAHDARGTICGITVTPSRKRTLHSGRRFDPGDARSRDAHERGCCPELQARTRHDDVVCSSCVVTRCRGSSFTHRGVRTREPRARASRAVAMDRRSSRDPYARELRRRESRARMSRQRSSRRSSRARRTTRDPDLSFHSITFHYMALHDIICHYMT